eukprot:Rmarinus@m.5335
MDSPSFFSCLGRLASEIPDKYVSYRSQVKEACHGPRNIQETMQLLASFLTVPEINMTVAHLFRPILPELFGTCIRAIRETPLQRGTCLFELSRLLMVVPHLKCHFLSNWREFHVFESLMETGLPLESHRRLLAIAHRLLWHAPADMLDFFNWNPIFHHIHSADWDCRWFACQCASIVLGLSVSERQKLLHHCLGKDAARVPSSVLDDMELTSRFRTDDYCSPPCVVDPDLIMEASEPTRLPLSRDLVDVCGVIMANRRGHDRPLVSKCFVHTLESARRLRAVALSACIGQPVLLQGPPGSGKTQLLRELCVRCGQHDALWLHMDDQIDSKTLLGSHVCTDVPGEFRWQPGALSRAVREGRWVIIEDLHLAPLEVVSMLSPLLERGELYIPGLPDPVIPPEHFRVFATCSSDASSSSYESRFVSRLWARCVVDAMSATEAKLLLEARFPGLNAAPWHVMQYVIEMYDILLRLQSRGKRKALPNPDAQGEQHPDTAPPLQPGESSSQPNAIPPPTAFTRRVLTIRDALKLCSRLSVVYEEYRHSQDTNIPFALRDALFMEAVDCFCGPLENPLPVAVELGAVVSLAADDVERRLHSQKPSVSLPASGNLRIGRASLLRKRSVASSESSSDNVLNTRVRSTYVETAHACRLLERLSVCVSMSEPTLLVGDAGCGKTAAVQYLASLVGRKLVVLNLSRQTDVSDLIGGYKLVESGLLCAQLYKVFNAVFPRTWSKKANAGLLDTIRHLYEKREYVKFASHVDTMCSRAEAKFSRPSTPQDKKQNTSVGASVSSATGETSEGGHHVDKHSAVVSKWAEVRQLLDRLRRQNIGGDDVSSAAANRFAFAFVEGDLVRALREGWWVLLDEINLASSEMLERLAGLLDAPSSSEGGVAGSLTLTERGDIDPVPRHPNFRLFACMNPPDTGKADLPPGIKSRFSEFWVSEASTREDLSMIVRRQLGCHDTCALDDETADVPESVVDSVVSLYLELREKAVDLVDGANHRPGYSLRTLTRALTYARAVRLSYGLVRALRDGVEMTFLTQLKPESRPLAEEIVLRHLQEHTPVLKKKKGKAGAGGAATLAALRQAQPPPRPPPNETEFVLFEGCWLPRGRLEPQDDPHFVLTDATPTIRLNSQNLARAIVARKFPVLLQGPTSSGKTSLVQYLARKTGHRLIRINNHEHTDIQEYLGSYVTDTATGSLVFQDGALVQAVRRGDWIVLDELNLAPSEVLEALNRLLDDNRELYVPDTQETVKPHPHFMLFATQNPPGIYGGRKVLSKAFRSRFLELHIDDLPDAEICEILQRRCHLAPKFSKFTVNVMRDLQRQRSATRLFAGKDGYITARDLIRWAARRPENAEELASDGYFLLAERCRTDAEKLAVKTALEKHIKVPGGKFSLDPELLYSDAGYFPSGLAGTQSVVAGVDPALGLVVWTDSMRRMASLVARCLKYKEPILLVGETGCGKTTICQLFSALLGVPLSTVSCHQHTETADFLGAFRPVRSRDTLVRKFYVVAKQFLEEAASFLEGEDILSDAADLVLEDMMAHVDRVEKLATERLNHTVSQLDDSAEDDTSMADANDDAGEGDANSSEGVDPVAARREAAATHRAAARRWEEMLQEARALFRRARALFEWSDGPLVSAMRRGHIFLADEISLAEDAVLERLNSVLEPSRTLVLAERGCIAGTGDVESLTAHSDFRFVGTMNPGGDFGKKELSPALRNRFTEIWVPTAAIRADLEVILRHRMTANVPKSVSSVLLSFVGWFEEEVMGGAKPGQSAVSLRDVLGWADFINTTCGELGPTRAFLHGASFALLDGIGISSGASSDYARTALKRRALQQLEIVLGSLPGGPESVREDLSALQYALAASTTCLSPAKDSMVEAPSAIAGEDVAVFGVDPFFIAQGGLTLRRPNYTLHASTTSINVLRLLRGLQLRKPILLEGSPGVGKTSLVQALGQASGHRVVRINLSDQTDMADLLGADLPVEGGKSGEFAWRDGVLLCAIKNGDWVLLDELNLAPQPVLEGLNAILDHRAEVFLPELGRVVKCPPSFRIFACQNPLHQGGGRKGLPKSFLNRFTKVWIDPLTSSDLLLILREKHPDFPQKLLEDMVRFNARLNDDVAVHGRYGRKGGPWEFNLRDMFRWCELLEHFEKETGSLHPAPFADMLYVQRMRCVEDREHVRSAYEDVMGHPLPPMLTRPFELTESSFYIGDLVLDREVLTPPPKDGNSPKQAWCGADDNAGPVSRGVPSELLFGSDLQLHRRLLRPLECLVAAVRMGWLVIIEGMTGSGKTAAIRALAGITGRRVHEVAVSGATDSMEILGCFEQADTSAHLRTLVVQVENLLCRVSRKVVVYSSQRQSEIDEGLSRRVLCDMLSSAHSLRQHSKLLDDVIFHANAGSSSGQYTAEQMHATGCQLLSSGLDLILAGAKLLSGEEQTLCAAEVARLQDSFAVVNTDGAAGAKKSSSSGRFEWRDGVLVTAARRGDWVVLDNANLCPPAVLDRLNPLLEPNGTLSLPERGLLNGEVETIRPHPNFRLFMVLDSRYGEVSRAMRNRGIELCLLPPSEEEALSVTHPEPLSLLTLDRQSPFPSWQDVNEHSHDISTLNECCGVPGIALPLAMIRFHQSLHRMASPASASSSADRKIAVSISPSLRHAAASASYRTLLRWGRMLSCLVCRLGWEPIRALREAMVDTYARGLRDPSEVMALFEDICKDTLASSAEPRQDYTSFGSGGVTTTALYTWSPCLAAAWRDITPIRDSLQMLRGLSDSSTTPGLLAAALRLYTIQSFCTASFPMRSQLLHATVAQHASVASPIIQRILQYHVSLVENVPSLRVVEALSLLDPRESWNAIEARGVQHALPSTGSNRHGHGEAGEGGGSRKPIEAAVLLQNWQAFVAFVAPILTALDSLPAGLSQAIENQSPLERSFALFQFVSGGARGDKHDVLPGLSDARAVLRGPNGEDGFIWLYPAVRACTEMLASALGDHELYAKIRHEPSSPDHSLAAKLHTLARHLFSLCRLTFGPRAAQLQVSTPLCSDPPATAASSAADAHTGTGTGTHTLAVVGTLDKTFGVNLESFFVHWAWVRAAAADVVGAAGELAVVASTAIGVPLADCVRRLDSEISSGGVVGACSPRLWAWGGHPRPLPVRGSLASAMKKLLVAEKALFAIPAPGQAQASSKEDDSLTVGCIPTRLALVWNAGLHVEDWFLPVRKLLADGEDVDDSAARDSDNNCIEQPSLAAGSRMVCEVLDVTGEGSDNEGSEDGEREGLIMSAEEKERLRLARFRRWMLLAFADVEGRKELAMSMAFLMAADQLANDANETNSGRKGAREEVSKLLTLLDSKLSALRDRRSTLYKIDTLAAARHTLPDPTKIGEKPAPRDKKGKKPETKKGRLLQPAASESATVPASGPSNPAQPFQKSVDAWRHRQRLVAAARLSLHEAGVTQFWWTKQTAAAIGAAAGWLALPHSITSLSEQASGVDVVDEASHVSDALKEAIVGELSHTSFPPSAAATQLRLMLGLDLAASKQDHAKGVRVSRESLHAALLSWHTWLWEDAPASVTTVKEASEAHATLASESSLGEASGVKGGSRGGGGVLERVARGETAAATRDAQLQLGVYRGPGGLPWAVESACAIYLVHSLSRKPIEHFTTALSSARALAAHLLTAGASQEPSVESEPRNTADTVSDIRGIRCVGGVAGEFAMACGVLSHTLAAFIEAVSCKSQWTECVEALAAVSRGVNAVSVKACGSTCHKLRAAVEAVVTTFTDSKLEHVRHSHVLPLLDTTETLCDRLAATFSLQGTSGFDPSEIARELSLSTHVTLSLSRVLCLAGHMRLLLLLPPLAADPAAEAAVTYNDTVMRLQALRDDLWAHSRHAAVHVGLPTSSHVRSLATASRCLEKERARQLRLVVPRPDPPQFHTLYHEVTEAMATVLRIDRILRVVSDLTQATNRKGGGGVALSSALQEESVVQRTAADLFSRLLTTYSAYADFAQPLACAVAEIRLGLRMAASAAAASVQVADDLSRSFLNVLATSIALPCPPVVPTDAALDGCGTVTPIPALRKPKTLAARSSSFWGSTLLTLDTICAADTPVSARTRKTVLHAALSRLHGSLEAAPSQAPDALHLLHAILRKYTAMWKKTEEDKREAEKKKGLTFETHCAENQEKRREAEFRKMYPDYHSAFADIIDMDELEGAEPKKSDADESSSESVEDDVAETVDELALDFSDDDIRHVVSVHRSVLRAILLWSSSSGQASTGRSPACLRSRASLIDTDFASCSVFEDSPSTPITQRTEGIQDGLLRAAEVGVAAAAEALSHLAMHPPAALRPIAGPATVAAVTSLHAQYHAASPTTDADVALRRSARGQLARYAGVGKRSRGGRRLWSDPLDLPPNVYTDADVAEVRMCEAPLRSLRESIARLLEEWPGHAVLTQLNQVTSRVLEMPAETPLMKVMIGLELVLLKVTEWNTYATRAVSLSAHVPGLSALVMRWRKIELASWPCVLEAKAADAENAAFRDWWFHMYSTILPVVEKDPSVDDVHISTVYSLLVELAQSSSLGQFEARLSLLLDFYTHAVGKRQAHSAAEIENDPARELEYFLWNLYQYYSQFVPRVREELQKLAEPIQQQLRDASKLAKWDSHSYSALRSSTEKAHRIVHKRAIEYEEVLSQGFQPFLAKLSVEDGLEVLGATEGFPPAMSGPVAGVSTDGDKAGGKVGNGPSTKGGKLGAPTPAEKGKTQGDAPKRKKKRRRKPVESTPLGEIWCYQGEPLPGAREDTARLLTKLRSLREAHVRSGCEIEEGPEVSSMQACSVAAVVAVDIEETSTFVLQRVQTLQEATDKSKGFAKKLKARALDDLLGSLEEDNGLSSLSTAVPAQYRTEPLMYMKEPVIALSQAVAGIEAHREPMSLSFPEVPRWTSHTRSSWQRAERYHFRCLLSLNKLRDAHHTRHPDVRGKADKALAFMEHFVYTLKGMRTCVGRLASSLGQVSECLKAVVRLHATASTATPTGTSGSDTNGEELVSLLDCPTGDIVNSLRAIVFGSASIRMRLLLAKRTQEGLKKAAAVGSTKADSSLSLDSLSLSDSSNKDAETMWTGAGLVEPLTSSPVVKQILSDTATGDLTDALSHADAASASALRTLRSAGVAIRCDGSPVPDTVVFSREERGLAQAALQSLVETVSALDRLCSTNPTGSLAVGLTEALSMAKQALAEATVSGKTGDSTMTPRTARGKEVVFPELSCLVDPIVSSVMALKEIPSTPDLPKIVQHYSNACEALALPVDSIHRFVEDALSAGQPEHAVAHGRVIHAFLEQWWLLVAQMLVELVDLDAACGKYCYVLSNVLQSLFVRGFCTPPDEQEAEEGGEEGDLSGTGIGEGQGEKDVSKEIDDEDQVLTMDDKKAQEEPQEKELKQEDGLEVSGDFEGKEYDFENPEDDDNGDDNSEESEEVEREVGDMDTDDENVVDKKEYDEEEDGPPSKDEKVERDSQFKDDKQESELQAKPDEEEGEGDGDNPDKDKKGADEDDADDSSKKQEPAPEGDNVEDLSDGEGDQGEDGSGSESGSEGEGDGIEDVNLPAQAEDDSGMGVDKQDEELELPDDLQLDGDDGDGSQQGEEADDPAADTMSDDDTNERGEDKMEVDEDNKSGDDGTDADSNSGGSEEGDPLAADAPEMQADGGDDADKPLDDDAQAERDEDSDSDGGKAGDEENEGGDPQNGQPDVFGVDLEDMGNDAVQRDASRPSERQGGEGETEGEGAAMAEADAGQAKERMQDAPQEKSNQPRERRPLGPNPFRSLSDSRKRWKEQLEVIGDAEAKEEPPEGAEKPDATETQDDTHDDAPHEFVGEKETGGAEALGTATDEQLAKQREGDDDASSSGDEDLAEEGTEQPADAKDDEGSDASGDVPQDKSEGPEGKEDHPGDDAAQRKKKSKARKAGDRMDDEASEASSGESDADGELRVEDGSRPGALPESDTITTKPLDDGEGLLDSDDEDGDDANALFDENEGREPGAVSAAQREKGRARWQDSVRRVEALASRLSDSLRLVLEPTAASKLAGDFRTGKRLNMRKIIPYIASNFRQDKIWLRRTKPNKREYQVLLAIDDSKSMASNGVDRIACDAIALICKAMGQLEVGQLGIVRFGETTEIVHSIEKPFSEEAGENMMSHFTFSQDKTDMHGMLKSVVSLLDTWKHRREGGRSGRESVQLVFIIGDAILNDRAPLRRWVTQALEKRQLLAFIAIDSSKHSILELKSVYYPQPSQMVIRRYLDDFPFPYYIVVRDVSTLPETLAEALRQWFEIVNDGQ